jgi:hypothetical protein
MAELRAVMVKLPDGAAVDAVVESASVNFHHFTQIVAAI